ncbi:serine hydrolase [Hominisplanchenecus murintestinalis]|uniref:serine hydrolase n=1 Tax=Hominisplanchenecus murintestinalis TaxID=2941517 RepID=UPI0014410702|nr:serine hydrolase [Hominisplanchenecus murintestinalis]
MKFKHTPIHNFYPRLLQAFAAALMGGAFYMGAYTFTYGGAAPTVQDIAPEIVSSIETEISSETQNPKKDTLQNTESPPKPKAPAERKVSSETQTFADSTDSVTAETSSELSGEYEIAESATETDVSSVYSYPDLTETSPAAPFVSGAPYAADKYAFSISSADTGDIIYVYEDDVYKISQFQPNYLYDLTEVSLSWEHLEDELISMTESYSGNWSVYVKNLANGDTIAVNQKPMESASLIKLYIMGAVMEQIHNGKLEETDTIRSLLNDMITVSDNEASNELVRYLSPEHDHKDGLTYVNSFAKRHGFPDTQHVNGLEDSSLRHSPHLQNETSTRDCGELLAQIYEGKLVSHLASRDMENLLLNQEITYKIPTAVPSEAVTANKTGEISDAENDAAIIYSPGGDFVLCIMSGGWDNGNQAIDHIRALTKLVYNHFNAAIADTDKYMIVENASE